MRVEQECYRHFLHALEGNSLRVHMPYER
jgi:hypothetical protein